jgi:AcrR family transcriptional regulator
MADGADRMAGRADLRRRQILEAAHACFLARGFHAATMAEIAVTAGLSVGQIYRFFEGKEAIIEAITDQQMTEFWEAVTLARGRLTARETIGLFISKALEKLCQPGSAALMLEVTAEASRNPRIAAMVQARDLQIRNAIEELLGHAEPGLRDVVDFEARAEMFCLMFEGAAARLIRHPDIDRSCLEALQNLMADNLLFAG